MRSDKVGCILRTCECDPGRGGLVVEPEGHPRHADNHERGHVYCDNVVGKLPLEYHVYRQAAVLACKVFYCSIC